MRHVMDASFATIGFKSAIEHGKMLGSQAALNDGAVFFDVLDGVEFLDVSDDLVDLRAAIAEALQGLRDSAVNYFEHSTTGEQFVFNEGDIRLHAGSIAVHEESNCAGGSEN